MERHLSDVCGWAPVSTIHSMPDMDGPPAGASVGARGGHAACSGHDGAGHRPRIFRAHPHAALQLPRKQRAPPSQRPLPLRTPVFPLFKSLLHDDADEEDVLWSMQGWSAVPPLGYSCAAWSAVPGNPAD